MKFGKVATDQLNDLDLSLPPDHPDTESILRDGPKVERPEVYVGCAKWGRKEWVGQIYPEGTKDKDFLSHYVQHFNSIELNSTFYGTRKTIVESWAEKAPDGFKFSPKFFRSISHFKRLNNAEEVTDAYLYIINSFGRNLGTSFLQLPENFSPKKFDSVRNYLEKLPENVSISVELRHPEWLEDQVVADETFNMLKELKKTSVITDVAGRRDCVHQRLSTREAFIRFNGYDLHPTDYTRLDEWVQRLKLWLSMGLERVYFYAHQSDEANTPKTCAYFIQEMNKHCQLDLEMPKFLN